jgi:hypothetical protein
MIVIVDAIPTKDAGREAHTMARDVTRFSRTPIEHGLVRVVEPGAGR